MNGSSGNDEIGTPDDLFEWLDGRFRLDYDAAASHENARCNFYSTKDGTFIKDWWGHPPALEDSRDGLERSWAGRRVFINPPYSRPLFSRFIEKAYSERNHAEIIVMLTKYDASTENGRRLRDDFIITDYLPRITYRGMTAPAPFSSVIAIAKKDWK